MGEINKPRILIVEDEAIIALQTKSCLQSFGYEVSDIAHDSEQALSSIKIENPDLILMDICIQGEKDGIETAIEIHKLYDIPIIFLTAYMDDDRRKKTKAARPYNIVCKPYDEDQLRSSIETALEIHMLEKQYKTEQYKYQIIFENSPEGIAIADIHSKKLIYVNNALCNMFGYGIGIDEFQNLYVSDIHPKEALEHIFKEFEAQAKGLKNLAENIPCKKKGGSIFYADINTCKMIIDDKECNVGFFRDKTEEIKKDNLYKNLFENSGTSNCIVDRNGIFTLLNEESAKVLGGTKKDFIGKKFHDIFPKEQADIMVKRLEKIIKEKKRFEYIDRFQTSKGMLWYQSVHFPLLNKSEEVETIQIIAIDVTEKKQYMESLEKALEEKSVLLREIHHRVKNNLQVISSLITLQCDKSNEEVKANLVDCKNRIFAMAHLHEKLYQHETISKINMRDYIPGLLGSLASSMQSETRIYTNINIEKIELDIDTALPCSLILNEIVSNCYKHAFTDVKEGKIQIEFKRNNLNYEIIVKDNGIGILEEIKENKKELDSLGMILIRSLTKQIRGSITISNKEGTEIKIVFPINR